MTDLESLGRIATGLSVRFLAHVATCIAVGDTVPEWAAMVLRKKGLSGSSLQLAKQWNRP